jgi:DUF4097 and DUF4098 domain-containing protein YvlB
MMTSTEAGVHEFACTGPIDAHVHVHSGDVTVTAVDQPVAVVAVSPEDDSAASHEAVAQTIVSFENNRLRVETPPTPGGGWLSFRRARVRVSLSLPVDSTLTTRLGSADLRTDGRLGTVNAHTGSGDVFVAETSGDLSAESGSGDVRCGRIGGLLRAHTASGDITANEVVGESVVDAASGDVALLTARGSLRAKTASGDIRIGALYGHDARIDAASGDVTVGVPAGTSVWLDLASLSGSTRNDLTPTGEPEGGPALSLRVHTMSGDIRVHRA